MTHMKPYIFLLFLFLSLGIYAQTEDFPYRRNSLYSILVNNTAGEHHEVIKAAFLTMPLPEKYNDHDLSVKVVDTDGAPFGIREDKENRRFTNFLKKNHVASRLVSKWFLRNPETGECSLQQIQERGLYNASTFEREMAQRSARSEALLMDAGEDLIGNTYVLVNSIESADKSAGAKIAGALLGIAGAVTSIATSNSGFGNLGKFSADELEKFQKFKVRINTFLYQLVWDDEAAGLFYKEVYSEKPDVEKQKYFEEIRDKFQLKYIGKVESKAGKTDFSGLQDPMDMVRKACKRALDENVVDLAHRFEFFRPKMPLLSTAPLKADIGLKEGLTPQSRYEVLEVVTDENGRRSYKRVGVVRPKADAIWDNRYMSVEENAANATLGATTFEKVRGGDFFPGMLIREINE